MNKKKLLSLIEAKAIEIDWEIAFQGKSYGNRHLERTCKIATYLIQAEQELGTSVDEFVVLAGAWLHDIGLINGNKNHACRGKNITSTILRFLEIESTIREKIEHCVEAHDAGSDAHNTHIIAETIEAKIVHDADTLDKMGPLGFIRHVWKLSVETQISTPEDLFTFIPRHLQERKANLYLETSRKFASRYALALKTFLQEKDHALIIIHQISQLARKGFPTEKIVNVLRNQFSGDFKDVLYQQMHLEDYKYQ
ncbi:MAG: HD domain-containing protein [Candidatus Heimdallarchaeota archaeon]